MLRITAVHVVWLRRLVVRPLEEFSFLSSLFLAAIASASPLLSGCAPMVKSADGAEKVEVTGSRIGPAEYVFHRDSNCNLPCTFPVWYGTNRKPLPGPEAGFSSQVDDALHYGKIYMTVPEGHDAGSTGSSAIVRFMTGRDDRITLKEPIAMPREKFLDDLREQLSIREKDEQTLLVYIHGYRTTFEEAAQYAAQIAFDVRFPGPTAFFSWPSRGTLVGYWADERTIEKSIQPIEDFLVEVSQRSTAKKVHLIAHSMGNRAAVQAMQRIVEGAQGRRVKFGQVILAAPDVAASDFAKTMKTATAAAEQTTLYVSEKDFALHVSEWLHGESRAGFYPPVTTVPNVSTVSVSNFDVSLLGHGYIASALEVIRDLKSVLSFGSPPEKRLFLNLRRKEEDGSPYWAFQ